MESRVVHILYGGLGGHAHVVFTLLKAKQYVKAEHYLIFYGVEEPLLEYKTWCEELSVKYYCVLKKKGEFIRPLFLISKILRVIKPNTIFTHSSNAIVISTFYTFLKNAKSIFVEHHANHLKSINEWFLSLFAIFFAFRIVYLSDEYRDIVRTKFKRLFNKKKALVIFNGVNLDKYSPKEKLDFQPLKIGMASRLVRIKDHHTLIKSFHKANLSDVILEIAGSGETLDELKQLTNSLKISDRVIFRGMLNEAELTQFYKNLDIYVHCSFGETMSVAISQAQACGLPIIASDVSGINNIIRNKENGILYKNSRELAEALTLLSNSKKFRDQLGLASRTFALTKLSDEIMNQKYYEMTKA